LSPPLSELHPPVLPIPNSVHASHLLPSSKMQDLTAGHQHPHHHQNTAAEAPFTTSPSMEFPGERLPPLPCPVRHRCHPHARRGDRMSVRPLSHQLQPHRVRAPAAPAGVGPLGRCSHCSPLGIVDPGSTGLSMWARFRPGTVHMFFFFPDFVIRFKFQKFI
jgi:hypothetical protein